MIELLAFAPEDGWAYIQTDAKVRLVRPPFTRESISVVQKESVVTALTRYGFVLPPEGYQDFPNWSALFDFLRAQLVQALKAKGEWVADDSPGEDLLAFAPPDKLREFLARTEAELIPNEKWDHAENLLLKMLALPSFPQQVDLYERAVGLLGRVSQGRAKKQKELFTLAQEDVDFPKTFPRAAEHYGQQEVVKLAEEIACRGTIFSF